jgi:hypothetical protein
MKVVFYMDPDTNAQRDVRFTENDRATIRDLVNTMDIKAVYTDQITFGFLGITMYFVVPDGMEVEVEFIDKDFIRYEDKEVRLKNEKVYETVRKLIEVKSPREKKTPVAREED